MFKDLLNTIIALNLLMGLVYSSAGCDAIAQRTTVGEAATIAPEDRDPNRLWCNEHGLYEDECVICHPELASNAVPLNEPRDPNRLWCGEHGVYGDECVICHPELASKFGGRGHVAADGGLFCNEHGVAELECGICHPEQLSNLAPGEGLKVRFASEASPAKAGVTTATPSPGASPTRQALLGRVVFNRNRFAYVTPPAPGIVKEVLRDVGERVERGEALAMVESAELAEAVSAYVTARAHAQIARQTLAREKTLYEQEISARQDYEQAQAAVTAADSEVTEACHRLIALGIPEADLDSPNTASTAFPVRAPLDGTVIGRDAVQGMRVELGQAMFHVADLSSVWMEVSVPEDQLANTPIGAPVQARFEAYPGVAFEGEIAWIAPAVDPQTRMVQARVILPNPHEMLKDGMFGRADLSGVTERAGLTVPESAVQHVDGREVVFTKIEDDLFETRLVDIGEVRDGRAVVLAGLNAQDEIVTDGSYIVKSELLKARLGAGCTDH